jgi:hypothetical protein
MDRGRAHGAGVRGIRTPGRASGELRDLHAPGNDRGRPPRAAWPLVLVGGRGRRCRARQADRCGDAHPRALPGVETAWAARRDRCAQRVRAATRARRPRGGARGAVVLDDDRQRQLPRHQWPMGNGHADARPHDGRVRSGQPADRVDAAASVARAEHSRPRRHRVVALAPVGRAVGRRRAALLRPLLLAAGTAARADHRRCARAVEPARGHTDGRPSTRRPSTRQ